MTNANVIGRIVQLLERFERGEMSATALDDQIEDYVSALEGLRSKHITECRSLSARLVKASFTDEGYPGEDKAVVLSEFKSWIGTLPQ